MRIYIYTYNVRVFTSHNGWIASTFNVTPRDVPVTSRAQKGGAVRHEIQRQLFGSRGDLHHSRQEGHGVEESGDPGRLQHATPGDGLISLW